MKKYEIIDSTPSHFIGIIMDFSFDNVEVGDLINILGIDLKLNQKGLVMALSSETNILVMQEVRSEQGD